MKLLCLWLTIGISISYPLWAADTTLATVGNEKIGVDEFRRRAESVRSQALMPPPDLLLEDMIRFDLGEQEAEKMHLQNDPEVKDQYKHILYNALIKKQLGKKIEGLKVVEGEMRAYYKKNPEVHLAYILIETKADATPPEREALRKKALDVLAQARKGAKPFEDLVHEYSDDVNTKDSAGDIGFQTRLSMAPALYDAAIDMKVGEVRGPVETPFGYHILKLLEKHPYDLTDKRQLHDLLMEEKQAKLFTEYFDRLKKQYKVEINRDALKSLKR